MNFDDGPNLRNSSATRVTIQRGGDQNELFNRQGSRRASDNQNRKKGQHPARLLSHSHGALGRIPDRTCYSGLLDATIFVGGLSPVLSVLEVSLILKITVEEVSFIVPVFGDDDDLSVLRDDFLKLLERSLL